MNPLYPSEQELNFQGTFEIHIFVGPIDAPPETVQKFRDVCASRHQMKGLYLFLDFKSKGFHGVMQSSRYVMGTMKEAREACQADTDLLRDNGFEILREKIEAVAGITNVPETKEEMDQLAASHPIAASRGLYFEYHIQIQNKDEQGQVVKSDDSLRAISQKLEPELGILVPISYNSVHLEQRFFNTRTYGCGKQESFNLVDKAAETIKAEGIEVLKIIREFIVSDTNKELDAGWLEPEIVTH